MRAPGFGGPPLKQRAVPQASEATRQDTDEISTSSHPLTWLTGNWVGSWWGNGANNFDEEHVFEPEVDVTDLAVAADDPGYLDNTADRVRNANDEGMVLEVGPDAVQALANELQQTLMAAFGQGNVRVRADRGDRGDFRNHFEVKVQRDGERDADHELRDAEDDSSREQRQRRARQTEQQEQHIMHAEF